MVTNTTISLAAANSMTPWMAVRLKTMASISIKATSFGSAVVELEHTFAMGEDDAGRIVDNPQPFAKPILFTSAQTFRRIIPIAGAGFIRLSVTTPDGTADAQSLVTVVML